IRPAGTAVSAARYTPGPVPFLSCLFHVPLRQAGGTSAAPGLPWLILPRRCAIMQVMRPKSGRHPQHRQEGNMEPLAQRLRPRTLDEVCGQQHLLGKDKVFRRTIDSGRIPNMIFYGPSGVGKTTVAGIIAQNSGMHLHKLNGTTASTGDIKAVLADVGTLAGEGGILLYLDE